MTIEIEREVSKMFAIMFWDSENLWTEIAKVNGCEASYYTFKEACKLAELISKDCALVDLQTGEIVALQEIEG